MEKRNLMTIKQANYVNLAFLELLDGQTWTTNTKAKVDVQILRFSVNHGKEKQTEISSAFQSSCQLAVDDERRTAEDRSPVIPIPKDTFNIVNGHTIKSLKLAIKVTLPASRLVSPGSEDDLSNGNENEKDKDKDDVLSGRLAEAKINNDDSIVYTGLLPIYDAEAKINILAEGNVEFDMRLSRLDERRNLSNNRGRGQRILSWQGAKNQDKMDEYLNRTFTAKLRIALRLTTEKMPPVVSHTYQCPKKENIPESVRVVYYVGGEEEAGIKLADCRNDLTCPWCSINCIKLYSLFKHLIQCHPRFNFEFTPIAEGTRVDVTRNESYNGSSTESPFDLVLQPQCPAFGRVKTPSKRTEISEMVTFKPKSSARKPHTLQEFFDGPKHTDRSYMIRHNRGYHHTSTLVPIHPREVDDDSEEERSPSWLMEKAAMMIDEFTDVNEAEKQIMKMWNEHVTKENYVGDRQIPLACTKFVECYGQTIVENNLYRNFVLHITNLFDFGLLPGLTFHTTLQQLQSLMRANN